MRLSLRFIIPLVAVLTLITYAVVPLVENFTLRWFVRDLDIRSKLVSDTVQDSLAELVISNSRDKIQKVFEKLTEDERLFAIGFCDVDNRLQYKTLTFPKDLSCGLDSSEDDGAVVKLSTGSLHVASFPFEYKSKLLGRFVLIHDMSFIERRSADTKKYIFYFFAALGLAVSFITVLIAQISWHGWVAGVRSLLKGEGLAKPLYQTVKRPELMPLAKDLKALLSSLDTERQARDVSQMTWTPRALKTILNQELAGEEILIVSNREPYIHNWKKEKIEMQVPASGLVTALEPVMRACSGTWIAHGSGTADREVVDKHDRIRVPPEKPAYSIRRVWLTEEEEKGYYYGFSNEGLWPLCHIAHTRPIFRTEDWNHYVEVNKKFAAAVLDEAKTDDPVILVQDYHFALLPRMIREKLPNATIISFWHIPWPNPEAFGICPWREEILAGLLGSSIMGFHTRFHCNNFIDTVDRFLEARIDMETSTVSYGGKLTAVKNYPISIEWPARWSHTQPSVADCRKKIRELNGMLPDQLLGVGVDRLDYTKGILERFLSVERLLETYPEWRRKFSFVQIAAPSRSNIDQYQSFEKQVRELADRINEKFGEGDYKPIHLKIEHHEPDMVFEYYRAADLCMVTSLHDGMNLVAKEFVSAKDDYSGVLILSQFTGAARELQEALVVNPYNIDQCATALHIALTMPAEERRERMRSMRGYIQEFNIYRWAGRMLVDAAHTRQRQRLMGRIQETENSLQNGSGG